MLNYLCELGTIGGKVHALVVLLLQIDRQIKYVVELATSSQTRPAIPGGAEMSFATLLIPFGDAMRRASMRHRSGKIHVPSWRTGKPMIHAAASCTVASPASCELQRRWLLAARHCRPALQRPQLFKLCHAILLDAGRVVVARAKELDFDQLLIDLQEKVWLTVYWASCSRAAGCCRVMCLLCFLRQFRQFDAPAYCARSLRLRTTRES